MKNLKKIIIFYSLLLLLLLNGVIAINSYFLSGHGFAWLHAIANKMDSTEKHKKQLKSLEEFETTKLTIKHASYRFKTIAATSLFQLPLSVIAILLLFALRVSEAEREAERENRSRGIH